MAHFGILFPPTQGHIKPFLALAQMLMNRGHRFTVFGILDLHAAVERAGVGFWPVGETAFPLGSAYAFQQAMIQYGGLDAMLHWNNHNVRMAQTLAPQLLDVLSLANLDGLLIDQIDVLGASIADVLDIPFMTVCVGQPFLWEPGIPPTFVDFEYSPSEYSEAMYRMMMKRILSDFAPVITCIQDFRQRHGLLPYDPTSCLYPVSPLGQVAQLPVFLDLPRRDRPATFHYTGLFAHPAEDSTTFPYDRLDGRPLVYASLGTLVNGKRALLQSIAEACATMNLQAVMPICEGGDLREFKGLPGNPVVVNFAPQRDILQRADLLITHAGLNTVLEGIEAGVPMVAIPISLDQPGTATRLKWVGLGEVVSFRRANTTSILAAMQTVYNEPRYRDQVRVCQQQLARINGAELAADHIEAAFASHLYRPVTLADKLPFL